MSRELPHHQAMDYADQLRYEAEDEKLFWDLIIGHAEYMLDELKARESA